MSKRKKKVLGIIAVIISIILFFNLVFYTFASTGSNKQYKDSTEYLFGGRFVVVEKWHSKWTETYYIGYFKDTKHMYFYAEQYIQDGTVLAPLFNDDGTIRIYEEE